MKGCSEHMEKMTARLHASTIIIAFAFEKRYMVGTCIYGIRYLIFLSGLTSFFKRHRRRKKDKTAAGQIAHDKLIHISNLHSK